jgi:hypothetical protein
VFVVDNIFLSVERNLLLLKSVGLLLVLGTTLYFILNRKLIKDSVLTWKGVGGLSVGMGIINAGIVIIFGKTAFFTTPLILIILLVLWFKNKFPQSWRGKYILALSFIFAISSVAIFLSVTLFFFHFAVEGKL